MELSELYEMLRRVYTDSPMPNENFASKILEYASAMGITSSCDFEYILSLQSGDVWVQDSMKINELKKYGNYTDEYSRENEVFRVVRRSFLNHFGIDWEIFLSKIGERTLENYTFIPMKPEKALESIPAILCKYCDSQGVIKILEGGKIRLSSPLNFNDLKDIQLDPPLPNDEVELAQAHRSRHEELIFSADPPKADQSNVRYTLNTMVRNIRAPTTTKEKFRNRNEENAKIIAKLQVVQHASIIKYWRHFVRYFRVLCLTSDPDSEYMWNKYGEDGKGVVLCFGSNPLSLYNVNLFPICYQDDPLRLIDPLDVVDSSFGIKEINLMQRISKMCFLKESKWSVENEWRCVFLRSDYSTDKLRCVEKKDLFDGFSFYKNSLTSVRFGKECNMKVRAKVKDLLRLSYPNVLIYE